MKLIVLFTKAGDWMSLLQIYSSSTIFSLSTKKGKLYIHYRNINSDCQEVFSFLTLKYSKIVEIFSKSIDFAFSFRYHNKVMLP